MNIIINTEALDLMPDSEASIQLSSPFFQDNGSYTLPLTLPTTMRNRYALGCFGSGLKTAVNYNGREVECIVEIGSHQEWALLVILSYSNSGIECTLLMRQSAIMHRLDGVSLKKVMQGKTFTVQADASTNDQGSSASPGSGTNLDGSTASDAVVPLHGWGADGKEAFHSGALITAVRERLLSTDSNIYDADGNLRQWEVFPLHTPHGLLNDTLVMSSETGEPYTAMYVDAELMAGPEGIGYTVFLHLTYVLDCIFSYIGKKLIIPEKHKRSGVNFRLMLDRMVLLNQTIDALVPGTIYYDTLVPDVPCADLLHGLFELFGVGLMERTGGRVEMVLLDDVLSGEQTDLSSVFEQVSFSYAEPEKLSIAPKHISYDGDTQLDWTTLSQNYYIPAGGVVPLTDTEWNTLQLHTLPSTRLYGELVSHITAADGVVLYTIELQTEGGENRAMLRELGIDTLDLPVTLAQDEQTDTRAVAAPVAMTRMGDWGKLPATEENDVRVERNSRLFGPLMPGMRSETCTVLQTKTTTTKTTDGNEETTTEQKDLTMTDECPLVLAYYVGAQAGPSGTQQAGSVCPLWTGATDELADGANISDYVKQMLTARLSLATSGICHYMHTMYNNALELCAHRIEIRGWLPKHKALDQTMMEKVIVVGSNRVLIESIETETTHHTLQEVRATGFVVKI